MVSLVSSHGKPKHGAARETALQLQCDDLLKRRDQIIGQIAHLSGPQAEFSRPRAPIAGVSATQAIAWVTVLDAKGLGLRDTRCQVSAFSVLGQAGDTQQTVVCKSHPHPCWNRSFVMKLPKASDTKDLKKFGAQMSSLRNIMRGREAKRPKIMVTCDVVSKGMLSIEDNVLGRTTFFVEEGGAAIDCWAPLELRSGQTSKTMSLHVRLWTGKFCELDAAMAPLRSADARKLHMHSSQLLDRTWQKIEECSHGVITRDETGGDETKVSIADESQSTDAVESDLPPSGPCELSVNVRACSDLQLPRSEKSDGGAAYVAVIPCSKVFMRTTSVRLAPQQTVTPVANKFELKVDEQGPLGLAFGELQRGAKRSLLRVVSVHDHGLAAQDPRIVPGLLLSHINDKSLRGRSVTAVARAIKRIPRPMTLTFVRESDERAKATGRFKSTFEQVLIPSMSAEGLGNHNHVDPVIQISVFVRNKKSTEFLNLDDDPALQVSWCVC